MTTATLSPKAKRLPKRADVPTMDTWDLEALYPDDATWEAEFGRWSNQLSGYDRFQGRLGEIARALADLLRFDADFDRLGEKLGNYAYLKTSEDQANSDYQRMKGRYQHIATKAAGAASYIRPEILSIPPQR